MKFRKGVAVVCATTLIGLSGATIGVLSASGASDGVFTQSTSTEPQNACERPRSLLQYRDLQPALVKLEEYLNQTRIPNVDYEIKAVGKLKPSRIGGLVVEIGTLVEDTGMGKVFTEDSKLYNIWFTRRCNDGVWALHVRPRSN